ncbi:MAG: bifunctional 5,10-methylene-tetrahydrofolate dehydrogenase/5,10-methylene-tetrahydrofolate cyclohydrolase [Erysipelotrichaceae bacterium]|nr:bifunctional 5,10-methylene-tetrahydrofolate dehydrogenase/5,10-methylene-tetrahydrofolate cyclohydrolase [Erysipelotrichaceae bacterium]
MAEILKGKPVAASLDEQTARKVAELKEKGIETTLAILRVGGRSDDISYERGAAKKCQNVGIKVRNVIFPEDVSCEEFYRALNELNRDPEVHGILMFRPLPKHLNNEKARNYIDPVKDVDGCTDSSLGDVFINKEIGYAPCTAEAVMETLRYYNIDVAGKNVVVIGRSLVVGKPLAMLLMNRNATVTVCHSKTADVPSITRQADIVICCTGRMESINAEYVSEGQTVIDVGIQYNETKQKLCGDVLFEEVEPLVEKITPVPGGIGSVTTSVLVSHVAKAAENQIR